MTSQRPVKGPRSDLWPLPLSLEGSTAREAFLGRFCRNVDLAGPCWLWTGAKVASGYGRVRVGDRVVYAHRAAYACLVEPVPAGMVIDHMCHVRACVNPDHLRLATVKQNAENRDPAVVRSGTGVRGVYVDRRDGSFYVQVKHNYRTVSGGRFASLSDAAAAADDLRSDLFTEDQ